MYHHMDGWDWFWALPMMLLWALLLGAVVYAAVRLAMQHDRKPPAS